jgi:hypothetical protein
MSARASSITDDRNSLCDKFESLLRPRRLVDRLVSSRVETERKADNATSRFVDGSGSRGETGGDGVDNTIGRFMSRLEMSDSESELLDSESLLGSDGMLLEDYVWLERWWWKVVVEGGRWKQGISATILIL